MKFKIKYLKNDPDLEKEINFAINKINDRKIYVTEFEDKFQHNKLNSAYKEKSQVIDWLNEYSEVNIESSSSSSLIAVKKES